MMKRLFPLVLTLGMTFFAAAEENGTIMRLSNLSSSNQYETTRDYLSDRRAGLHRFLPRGHPLV